MSRPKKDLILIKKCISNCKKYNVICRGVYAIHKSILYFCPDFHSKTKIKDINNKCPHPIKKRK